MTCDNFEVVRFRVNRPDFPDPTAQVLPVGPRSSLYRRQPWPSFLMMPTDATEDDMNLARTEEADLDPRGCSGTVEVKKFTKDPHSA